MKKEEKVTEGRNCRAGQVVRVQCLSLAFRDCGSEGRVLGVEVSVSGVGCPRGLWCHRKKVECNLPSCFLLSP